jgi:hypothetical protein
MERDVRAGTVEAPEPFQDSEPSLTLPDGTSSLGLLAVMQRARTIGPVSRSAAAARRGKLGSP